MLAGRNRLNVWQNILDSLNTFVDLVFTVFSFPTGKKRSCGVTSFRPPWPGRTFSALVQVHGAESTEPITRLKKSVSRALSHWISSRPNNLSTAQERQRQSENSRIR